jgi:TIGR03009 family protein
MARLRLDNPNDKNDYEAYICNGKAVYEYRGKDKTITEIPLPANAGPGASDNLMLDFLAGMTAQAVQQRFDITVFKEDANYVYLDVKPRLPKDKQEFVHVRFALLGPNVPKQFTPYLPVEVWMQKPNGEEERWQLSGHQINLQGVDGKVFQPEMLPGFQFKRLPPGGAPAAGPGPAVPPKK